MTKITTRESSTRIKDKEPYILNEWIRFNSSGGPEMNGSHFTGKGEQQPTSNKNHAFLTTELATATYIIIYHYSWPVNYLRTMHACSIFYN